MYTSSLSELKLVRQNIIKSVLHILIWVLISRWKGEIKKKNLNIQFVTHYGKEIKYETMNF